jgi:hypothetical protein
MRRRRELTGRNVITIRKTAVAELQPSVHPTSHNNRGYADEITRAYGTVNINLPVGRITADVAAVSLDDHVQLIPIVVGQTLVKLTNATSAIHNDQVSLL